MFKRFFGASRKVSTLGKREWDQFIRLRREGKVGPLGRPVGDRQIEYDLKLLRAVCNWAMEAKVNGKVLLARNPFGIRSCKLPKEKNPVRQVMTEAQYQRLLEVVPKFDWRFGLAVVLANETGHRLSALRQLRWSEVDLDAATVHWRAEHDKTGYEHVTPLSEAAVAALTSGRRHSLGIGDAWIFPSAKWPDRPMSREPLARWLKEAQQLAGLEPTGWHAFRRKFATELKDLPLKDLCALGGWKDPKTVLTCYQAPEPERMRAALSARRQLGSACANLPDNLPDIASPDAPLSTGRRLS